MSNTSRVVLSVLQPGYQPLVLLPEVAAHEGGLADNHHVLRWRGVNDNVNTISGGRGHL